MMILDKLKFKTRLANHLLKLRLIGDQSQNNSQNDIVSIIFETLKQVKNQQFTTEDKIIFENLRAYRNQLAQSEEIIDYAIFGYEEKVKVKDTVNRASSPEKWCQFHYLLTKNLHAKTYVEIGTNLGVSGSYIISALKSHKHIHFVTLEGAPKLCEISEAQFSKILDPKNFTLLKGLYQDTFPQLLEMPLIFDMAFIDGNHLYQPTLEYFRNLKPKMADSAVYIFDDIYLNDEMVKAWKEIQNDPDVNYTIDLFKLGIVVIDRNDTARNNNYIDYLSHKK